jgi:peroxiredoxin
VLLIFNFPDFALSQHHAMSKYLRPLLSFTLCATAFGCAPQPPLGAQSPPTPRASHATPVEEVAMEIQATPSVLLPGLYLEDKRLPLKVGTRAPAFELPRCSLDTTSKTETVELASWLKSLQAKQGNGSIVVFWAFWCDTWKDMVRDLNVLRPTLHSMKLQVLAVSVDASQQPVARASFKNGRIWWPVAIDEKGGAQEASTCAAQWGVRRVPTIFVLDKNGVIRAVFEGFPGKSTFVKKTAAALKIATPGARPKKSR